MFLTRGVPLGASPPFIVSGQVNERTGKLSVSSMTCNRSRWQSKAYMLAMPLPTRACSAQPLLASFQREI